MSSTNGSGGGGGGESGYTYVYYFIPQDGDSEDHPNAFLIRKPGSAIRQSTIAEVHSATPKHTCTRRQPRRQTWHHALFSPRAWTHAHIRLQHFPLPGEYFFRFKQAYAKGYGESHTSTRRVASRTDPCVACLFVCLFRGLTVWVDGTEYTTKPVPQFMSRIVCKVTRLHLLSTDAERAAATSSTATGATPSAAAAAQRQRPQPQHVAAAASASAPVAAGGTRPTQLPPQRRRPEVRQQQGTPGSTKSAQSLPSSQVVVRSGRVCVITVLARRWWCLNSIAPLPVSLHPTTRAHALARRHPMELLMKCLVCCTRAVVRLVVVVVVAVLLAVARHTMPPRPSQMPMGDENRYTHTRTHTLHTGSI